LNEQGRSDDDGHRLHHDGGEDLDGHEDTSHQGIFVNIASFALFVMLCV
jgi:hypothetical protein